MSNKVEFGISNLHIGLYTVSDQDVVTMGTPYHQKGAKNFSPDQDSNDSPYYADDMLWWNEFTDGAITGDLEVALFDDAFKTQFLGYRTLADGGLAQVKNAVKPNVYIAFEIKGDKEKRRVIFYNCQLGTITREYAGIEDKKEPISEKINVSVAGDNATGATKAVYKKTDAGYSTLFTQPSAPVFPES